MFNYKFTYVSIYGGIGMGGRALALAGGLELACVDIGELQEFIYKQQTFHSDSIFIRMDARMFTLEILNEYLVANGRKPILRGEVDVLLISSSCKYISRLNRFATPWADENLLLLETSRLLDSFQSKLCLIENVAALSVDKEMQPLFIELKRSIHTLGTYEFSWGEINSADFNIPQSRSRFVGVAKRADLPGAITYPAPTTTDYSALHLNRIIPSAVCYETITKRRVSKVVNDDIFHFKKRHLGMPNEIIGTITASGGEKVLELNGGWRKITIEELKKFFGIEEFTFNGISYTDAHLLIGNGIAVPFLRCIMEHLYNTLLAPYLNHSLITV